MVVLVVVVVVVVVVVLSLLIPLLLLLLSVIAINYRRWRQSTREWTRTLSLSVSIRNRFCQGVVMHGIGCYVKGTIWKSRFISETIQDMTIVTAVYRTVLFSIPWMTPNLKCLRVRRYSRLNIWETKIAKIFATVILFHAKIISLRPNIPAHSNANAHLLILAFTVTNQKSNSQP